MAKTGGTIAKLAEKSKRNAMAKRMGTHKPTISRVTSTYHDKLVALRAHQETIAGGFNPGPAECFRGDGLPDEVIAGSKNWEGVKPPKSMAQRAEEDKRKPLRDEMRDGWKPEAWVGIKLNRSDRRALERSKG
jgi:hypothetical protein